MRLEHFAMRWWPEVWLLTWKLLDDVDEAGKATGEIILVAFHQKLRTRRALFELTIKRCQPKLQQASMLLLDLDVPLEECAEILALPPREIVRHAYEARLHLMSAR